MAIMIPTTNNVMSFHGSEGETLVYSALEKLSDDYIVFHSTPWITQSDKKVLIEGEADFIVFNKYKGLLFIEVKSGNFRVEHNTWYQTNRRTNEEIKLGRSPFDQAQSSKYYFSKKLKSHHIELKYTVAAWFTSLDEIPPSFNQLNVDTRQILISKDLKKPLDAIEALFELNKGRNDSDFSQREVNRIISFIAPELNIVINGSLKYRLLEDKFLRMTNEQMRLLQYLEEQREAAIEGVAGTGKTVMAIELARRLVAKEGKVLFLCYNSQLMNYLRTVLDDEDIDVYNLNALFIRKGPKKPSKSLNLSTNDLITNYLNNDFFDSLEYRHIIIDEAQDISNKHVLILKNYCEMTDGYFYTFYDKKQRVQQWEELDWVHEMDCKLKLFFNCRNTIEIADTSLASFTLEDSKKSVTLKGESGLKPRFYYSFNHQYLINSLLSIIQNYISEGFNPEDIVVITLKTLDESILKDYERIGKYKLNRNEKAKSNILFTTARKFKGLESKIVIVIDVSESTFSIAEEKQLFYVATSRAISNLDIIFSGDENNLKGILKTRDIKYKYYKNEIQKLLKVEIFSID